MYQAKRIAVVIPAFNEETQILKMLENLPSWLDKIIVIDDCSTDSTSILVNQKKQEDKRIHLIQHKKNQGVGGAIASGYKLARDENFDAAVVMAGDGQMDAADLPLLLSPLFEEKLDYVKANRLLYKDSYKMIPKTRFWGNSILSLLTKIASGYWHISDSQTGYTVISLKALKTIDWDQMYKRYGQPNDLLVRLNIYNFRVKDVPLKPVYNIGESSKMKIKTVVVRISWILLKMFFWRLKEKYVIRDFHPLVFFYGYGFLGLFGFFLFFIRFFYLWISAGSVPQITLLSLLFCLGSGVQSLFFAMWFDQEQNKNLR